MKRSSRAVMVLGVSVCVSLIVGCAAVTRITSTPEGATITLNGNYVGETPVSCTVKDELGQTTYTFVASKSGYRTDSKAVQERPFEDPKGCIPPHIHFDLQPLDSEKK